jgi:hypothetical protein|tara:strand:+ start:5110 stop:5856 length:747 start_codon:yes stop_codon:yes gene_type:complete
MRNKNKFITTPKSGRSNKDDPRNEFLSIIIFAENHGYRMKSQGPIPLLKLKDKTLLEKQIEAIQSAFLNFEIILCSGFETEKTVSYIKQKFSNINIRVVENQVHFNSNCCESARLCLNNTSNSRILFFGGSVLPHWSHLQSIDFNKNCVMVQDQEESFEITAIHNESSLESLTMGLKDSYWVETCYLANQDSISDFYGIISNPEFKNRFMFEAINKLASKQKIHVLKNTEKPVYKINNIKTFRRMQKK